MTFSRRSTKPSSFRLSVCARRTEGWNVKSKSAMVLTAYSGHPGHLFRRNPATHSG
jgi:hypothetical protein